MKILRLQTIVFFMIAAVVPAFARRGGEFSDNIFINALIWGLIAAGITAVFNLFKKKKSDDEETE